MPLFLREKRKFVVFSALIFFHLVLISLQVPLGEEQTYFEKAIFSVFSPAQHGIVSLLQKMGNLWSSYFYLRNVQSQNQKMRKEIFSLRQENNLLRNALQKLQKEKEIQDILSKMHQSFLVASVIGVDASNIYKSIVINKGTLNGLRRNMAVIDKQGNLVGRVIGPVSLNEARVQLITDSQCGISVFSQSKKAVGVLTGDAQGKCILKYVLATSEDISEGEEVFTSGFDSIFPPGLKVGKVVSVSHDTSLFKKIIVKPHFDFRNLEKIAVLKSDSKVFF